VGIRELPNGRTPQSSEPGDERLVAACRQVLVDALQAPSPQNRQPWKIQVTDTGFELYLDESRVAVQTDPLARQAHLALGSFLELCAIAASTYGYMALIELFPVGTDPLDALGRSPVAVVAMRQVPDEPDPLAAYIAQRHSNRRAYDGPGATASEITELTDCGGDGSVVVANDHGLLRQLKTVLAEAMRIDTTGEATHGEKVSMIRASDQAAAAAGDGFTYPNLGYTGRTRTLVEMLYPLRGAHSRWFRYGTMFVARRVLRSAPAVALLVSPGNTRVDQVEAGRTLLRTWLTATRLGLVCHPMCQVLQELPEQADTRASFQGLLDEAMPGTQLPTALMATDVPTVQVVMRLGRATATPPSPRRSIDEVLAP